MKQSVIFAIGLALALTTGPKAQGVIGTWQGTLPIPASPRTVLRISKKNDGSLRGSYVRIDVTGFNVPLTAVIVAGSKVTIASEFAGMSFDAKLSDDGKTLAGNWTQRSGPQLSRIETVPVAFSLASEDALWKPANAVTPMDATADPAYEIASIKGSQVEGTQWYFITRNRKFEASNMPIKELIKFAYEIRGRQVEGGPAWINELRIDIQAEPDTPGVPSIAQHRAMCRKLLTERFGLSFHWIERVFPIYELSVAKSSPGLTKSETDDPTYQVFGSREKDGASTMRFEHTSMRNLAAEMMNFVQDRHIVDATGLKGEYDFTLKLPPGMFDGKSAAETEVDPAAGYSKALEAVGLKMVASKGPLPVMVVDRLDKPSAN